MTALVFPPSQRGLGLALMAVVANAAAALGPPVGGVLVELAGWPWDSGWHWIFLINVPIGIVGLVLAAARAAGDARSPRRHEGGLVGHGDDRRRGLLPHVRARGGEQPGLGLARDRRPVRGRSCSGSRSRSRSDGPLPDVTAALVKNRQFVSASLALLLFGAGMMGTLFMTVLAFVNLWDYSELKAALAVTPVPVMALLVCPAGRAGVGPVSPRVVRRAGPRRRWRWCGSLDAPAEP